MPLEIGTLDEKSYDFLAELQELLETIDVNDKVLLVRRAIQMHALSVALYFPRLTQLAVFRKGRAPKVDMIAIARRHAAVKLFEHFVSPVPRRHPPSVDNVPLSIPPNSGFTIRIKRIRFLKELLALESGGLSLLLTDPSLREYRLLFHRQLPKSEAVAILMKAYMTNGSDLKTIERTVNRYPLGLQTMRNALCYSQMFKKSEKTLDNCFVELDCTSVFHYMMRLQGCWELLTPIYPGSPNFARKILRRARDTDEFAGACQMYNTIASELNSEYGFSFFNIGNVPQIESVNNSSPTLYPHDQDLAKAIKEVTGITG